MNHAHLSQLFSATAREHKYKKNGNIFWKKEHDLAVMIHLQRSRWCSGVYINTGVLPSAMILGVRPPPAHCWVEQVRATDAESPYRQCFMSLADAVEKVNGDEMQAAAVWLFERGQLQLKSQEAFRSAILSQVDLYKNSMLHDWALKQTKSGELYWPDVSYYR